MSSGRGKGGVCQKMTQDDKGDIGVWNGPKKDDVIYEQPLITIVD